MVILSPRKAMPTRNKVLDENWMPGLYRDLAARKLTAVT